MKQEELKSKNWRRDIILFLSSQAVSLFGSSLVQYAIIWYITLSTGSGVMMTISTIVGVLPQVLISVFAGVWADRYNRKVLIMVSDSCIALSTLILAILFLFGINDLWLIFVALGIRSLGSGAQTPAVSAVVPQIVPEDKLLKINGINGTIQSLILILSPIASAAFLGLMEIGNILLIDVITAFIGVGILSFLKISKIENENEGSGYYEDIKQGINYVKKDKFINQMLKVYAIFCFIIGPISFLTPLMIARTFGVEPWRLSANEVVFFIGGIIGGIILSTWGGFKNRMYTIGVASVIYGICFIFLGFSTTFIIYLVFMGLIGISMPFFSTVVTALLQEIIDAKMLGRIFSLVQIIGGSIMPLSMLLYGPLSDVMKIETLLIITGIITILIGGIIFKYLGKLYINKMEDLKKQKEETKLGDIIK